AKVKLIKLPQSCISHVWLMSGTWPKRDLLRTKASLEMLVKVTPMSRLGLAMPSPKRDPLKAREAHPKPQACHVWLKHKLGQT
ncbi:hypothetical protein PIB30_057993, partial [Stylosanthes scabra]|nr:hypothetical protein [Stylosanthes scabra]